MASVPRTAAQAAATTARSKAIWGMLTTVMSAAAGHRAYPSRATAPARSPYRPRARPRTAPPARTAKSRLRASVASCRSWLRTKLAARENV